MAAEVVYAEGKVEASGSDGAWKDIDIGDQIPRGDSVRTGEAASCVIKFSYLGAIRIGPASFATVESLVSQVDKASSVRVGLTSGTIVCKVRKLAAKDSFEVHTNVAVCSVRGTEFLVQAGADGQAINVAVSDGFVAILPSRYDTISLRASAVSGGVGSSVALEASDALSSVSPVVMKGQEATIDAASMVAANQAYERLMARAKAVEASGGGNERAKAASKDSAKGADESASIAVADLTRKVISEINEVPIAAKELSASSKETFSSIRGVELEAPPPSQLEIAPSAQSSLPVPSAAKDEAVTRQETGAAVEERPRVEPEIQTVVKYVAPPSRKIRIETEPADASIYLKDRYMASGAYEASIDRGTTYSFTIAKSGYATVLRTVEPGEEDQSIRVALEALTASIDLASDPSGSMAYVDGSLVGSTPCTISGIVGQTLSIELRKPGYRNFIASIPVGAKTPSRIVASLEPIPIRMAFRAIPDGARLAIDGRASGVGYCVASRIAGTELSVAASAPGYLAETRRFVCGEADSEVEIRLSPLKLISRTRVSESSLDALAWYGDKLLYVDGKGSIGALRIGEDYDAQPAWTIQTKNVSMNKYQLQVREGKLAFAGSFEWISLDPDSGRVLGREGVDSERASLTGRPGLEMDGVEVRPMTNGLSIGRGEIHFAEGSLMYPTEYGNRLLLADSFGAVNFIDPQNRVVEEKVATKVVQSFETGFLIDGSRGFFAGRLGDVACLDLDKRKVLWQSKVEAGGGAAFLYDIQDGGSLLGLYSRGRMYFLSKASGAQLPTVIGNLSGRPWLDSRRAYAPTSEGDIVEYALPAVEAKRTLKVGGSIVSIALVPTPIPTLAVGLKDGTLVLCNPEGVR
jgi:Uncharacterized protein conserved in bacteria